MFLRNCCGSFAEICGDDESAPRLRRNMSKSWLDKFEISYFDLCKPGRRRESREQAAALVLGFETLDLIFVANRRTMKADRGMVASPRVGPDLDLAQPGRHSASRPSPRRSGRRPGKRGSDLWAEVTLVLVPSGAFVGAQECLISKWRSVPPRGPRWVMCGDAVGARGCRDAVGGRSSRRSRQVAA